MKNLDLADLEKRLTLSEMQFLSKMREEIAATKTSGERDAVKRNWYRALYTAPAAWKQSPEWNYAEDYRQHGGYDGWLTK